MIFGIFNLINWLSNASICSFNSFILFAILFYFVNTSFLISHSSFYIFLDCPSMSLVEMTSFTTRLTPVCWKAFDVVSNWVKLKIQVMSKWLKRWVVALWCWCLENLGQVKTFKKTTQVALMRSLHVVKMVKTIALWLTTQLLIQNI